MRAAHRFERPPAFECADEPRRNLRVAAIEADDGIGKKAVAAPVGAIELGLVAVREGADQGPYPVGIGRARKPDGG